MLISVLSRQLRVAPPPGGGGGSFPYGAAALPTGMTWDYTEGGTRTISGSPVSFSYSSVPTVTGTTYDASDAASWATAVASAVDGDGIRITADFSVSSPLSLSRTSSSGGWVLVFTDRKATLDTNVPYSGNYLTCTSTNRIDLADTTSFRTITTSGSTAPCIRAAQSAVGYWIVGVAFTASVNVNEALVDFGALTMTQESHFPSRMVLDRCVVDGAEKARRGVQMKGKDQLTVGCYITGATSTPQSFADSIGLWVGVGGKNLLAFNNRIEAESEAVMIGGADPAFTDFVPGTDYAIIRNHISKPTAWDSDVSYALKKNMFETKSGVRVLFFGNVVDHFRSADQFHQMVLKTEIGNSAHTWVTTTDLTIVGNYFINGTEGGPFNISPQGSNTLAHGPMARVTIAQNFFKHGSSDSQSFFQVLSGSAAPEQLKIDNLHVEHNTWGTRNVFFKPTVASGQTWSGFVFRNNASWAQSEFGPVFTSTVLNKAALDTFFVNWTWAKNAIVSGVASWASGESLLGSPYLCIQDTAANMFTDPGTADYTAKTAGPLDGTATDGFDVGADIPWIVDTLTAGVV